MCESAAIKQPQGEKRHRFGNKDSRCIFKKSYDFWSYTQDETAASLHKEFTFHIIGKLKLDCSACWEVGIRWTYRHVSGWVQEDDQQCSRQAAFDLGLVGSNVHQSLGLETEHRGFLKDPFWGASAARILTWSSFSGLASGASHSSLRWSFPWVTPSKGIH